MACSILLDYFSGVLSPWVALYLYFFWASSEITRFVRVVFDLQGRTGTS